MEFEREECLGVSLGFDDITHDSQNGAQHIERREGNNQCFVSFLPPVHHCEAEHLYSEKAQGKEQ